MAEAVVELAVEALTSLIVREADLLIGVNEKVEWIDTEFKLMVAHLQSIDALNQIPTNAYGCMEETRSIIRSTENMIETYAKTVAQSKTAALRKISLFSWYEKRNLGLDLEKIKYKIIRVRQRWKSVDFHNQDLATSSSHRDSSGSVENQDLATSSSHHVPSGSAAIRKLDGALQSKYVNGELLMRIRLVRDEVVRLHKFSLEIDAVISLELLSERQKVWIQELRNIFQFVDESFASLESSSFLLFCTGLKSVKYGKTISEIQSKIFLLYRRYYVYGVGEIQVNNDGASRSIFPSIRMDSALISSVTEERGMAFSPLISSIIVHVLVHILVSLPEARKIESLEVDMKLMKALLEDAKSMRCLDKRVNVWLDQMRKISNDLENLVVNSRDISQGKNGWAGHIFGPSKIANKLRLIRHEMRDIAARKRRYGIDIAMGEAGKSLNFTAAEDSNDSSKYLARQLVNSLKSFIFKDDFTRQIQSVELELQLMQAFLEDVNTMENIDARLKFWVEELRGVEREAMAILEHQSTNSPYGRRFERIGVARRIYRFNNRISVMSKWKQTYDIVDVRSRKISNFVNHELREIEQYPSRAEDQEFELIRRELRLMAAFDRDIRDMDGLDGTAKVWVEKMHNIAEDAKKLILSYDRDDTELTRKSKFAIAKSLNIFFTPVRRLGTRDVARINDRIVRLSEIRMEYGIEHRKKLPPYIVSELKAKLLEHHEYPCAIPVIGMSDTHKEALKELLHNEKAITGHFDCWAWVCVSRELSGTPILRDTLKQIMDQQTTGYLEEETMQMLAKVLSDKRFLVVLDEVQSVEIWNFLEPAFRQTSTGSRIILVTHEHTYSLLNSNSDGLSDNTGLRRQMEDTPEVFEKLSLLAPVKLTKIQSETGDENTVPSYLKQCLYYFLLFPANIEVQVRRLIVLWVAEGLVRPNRDINEPVERSAESYLNKLIDLKMVQVTKKKLNGKVKACQLYDGKRDMWLEKAKEARFFPHSTTEKINRLVDYHGGNESWFIKIHGNSNSSTSLGKYKDVHSFLSFDSREGGKPGEDIGNFLRKCIAARCFLGLRVLDLERVFRPKLPEKIALLTGLRYLGLRWTYLENLPTYIFRLLNLQVLDVKHTYISILPRTIWSMQYLRHLYLSETFRTRFVGRPSEVSLTELQTLWGAFVDEDTAVKQGLDTLTKIRKLGLTCRSRSSQHSKIEEQPRAVDRWIANLESLESLRLKSRDESGNPSDLHLSPLTRHPNLSTVYLLGKLQPNVVSDFPNTLADITLSGSELCEDPMNSLGKLQNLLILRLLAKSVKCVALHCSSESFPQLKLLSLWKLELLKQWEVEEGGLPSLEDLEIRSCINLKMLPEALNRTVTLKSFKLTNMPEKFTDDVKDKQTDLWHRIEPVLEVRNFT